MDLKSEFNEFGFCYLPNVIGKEERLRIENDILKIINSLNEYSKIKDFTYEKDSEGNSFLKRFQNQWKYSESLLQSLGNPKILNSAWEIYGKNMVPTAESLVINSPGKNSGFNWHQDGYNNSFTDKDRGLNIGLYINDSTKFNGAVHVIPKSHLHGKIDFEKISKNNEFNIQDSLRVDLKGGDALIHSRSLAHGAPANSSKLYRITSYYGFIHRSTLIDIYSNEDINKRLNLISIGVEARKDNKLFHKEDSFNYKDKLGIQRVSNYKIALDEINFKSLLNGF